MSGLELKVPPDVAWLVIAGAMWLTSAIGPRVSAPAPVRVVIAAALVAAGVALVVSARIALARASTTWRPTQPERTARLVSSGVYRLSRNPIYLGMLFVLLGLAVVLASPAALVLAAVYVLYIDRFQIRPEERALRALLGQEYVDYSRRVRRWV